MKALFGEGLGTFILVMVGLATVVNADILGALGGLYQVAILWGGGVTIAIFTSRGLSGAHLNPAITIAFASTTDFQWSKVPGYILAQCIGAFLGAALVYMVYGNAIAEFEEARGIVRGTPESIRSAMVFGEFFPNPAILENTPELADTKWGTAFWSELLGTALLAFVIFSIIRIKQLPGWSIPILIGVALAVLIYIFAPFSMAGFNPARDLMPRAFSSLAGWGSTPFSATGHGWITVYVVSPVVGALLGAYLAKLLMGTILLGFKAQDVR